MLDALVRKAAKTATLPAGPFMRRRQGDVVVLLYHRIGDGRGEIELPAQQFGEQLAYLSGTQPVLGISDALIGLRDGRPGGVAISFDDGTPDFISEALPLLQLYRVPVVLYLATALMADPSHGGSRRELSWSELRDAVATGLVTIGAHTHTHADLSVADERQADEEMRRSKEMIENQLGVGCRHFAYPWGVGSDAADRVARRLFDSAAIGWGTNRRGRTDPHRLHRTPVLRNDGDFFFKAKARGFLDGEAFVYRALRRGPWRKENS